MKKTSTPRKRTAKPKDTLPAVVVTNTMDPPTTKQSATFALFRDDLFNEAYDDEQEPYSKLLKKYGHSTTWVYIAVSRLASAAAQIPIIVIKRDRENQPNAIVRKYDGGLLDLLERPNPFQSQFDFIEACIVSLALTGNLYIELAGGRRADPPKYLYVLNPSRVTVIPGKKHVMAYKYRVNGKEITFPETDIIHVKYPHPTNDYYGLSPLTAARLAVELDRGAVDWNRSFMNRGGWPGGSIETPNAIEPLERKRIQKEIRAAVNVGKEQAGRILLLSGGLKYNKLAVTPKETDWLDARRMSRDEILAIFGVPYAVAGLFSTEQTTARSAGVEQQIKQFYQGRVRQEVKRLYEALNRELVPFYSDNFKLIPDLRAIPALQDDVDTEAKRAQAFRTLVASGVPINYAMSRFYPEWPPVAWGDIAWVQSGMVAVNGPFNPVLQEADGGPIEAADPAQSVGGDTAGENPQNTPPASGPRKSLPSPQDAWARVIRRAKSERQTEKVPVPPGR